MTKTPTIAYCVLTLNREAELRVVLNRMAGHVDKMIAVDGGSVDNSIYYVRNRGDCELVLAPWRDDFCWSRNRYVEAAKALHVDWILVSDTDEVFSVSTAANMHTLVTMFDDMGFYCASFRDEAVTMRGETEIYRAQPSPDSFYKPLLAKVTDNLHYEGNPHHGWKWGEETKPIVRAPIQFCYSHVKQVGVIAERGARNFYIGGGGDNERVEKWRMLREAVNTALKCSAMCRHYKASNHKHFDPGCNVCMNLVPWPTVQKLMIDGELPAVLADWIIAHRHDNTRGGDSEVRECFLYYFRILHPELDPFPNDHILGQEASGL